MISYREEYFNQFLNEKIFKSSSFKSFKKSIDEVKIYGPELTGKDSKFISDCKNVLDVITSIIRKPQIISKEEEAIVRSDQAYNIDNESFKKTIKDSSLWKRKKGTMEPENVHVKQAIDSYFLYENIFVTKVLDFINNELNSLEKSYSKKVTNFKGLFETESYTYNRFGVFSHFKGSSYPYSGILGTHEQSVKENSKIVTKLLKKTSKLCSTPFYKDLHNAKVRQNQIMMTNILLKDRRYNTCYRFYKKYISLENDEYYLPIYQDYILMRMIKDLNEEYKFTYRQNKIKVTNSEDGLDFNKEILMKDRHFRYLITKDKENYGFIINVKLKNYDEEIIYARYYIILAMEINSENLDDYKEKVSLKYQEGYDHVTIITLKNLTNYYNGILVISFDELDDNKNGLSNLFTSYHMVFKCDFNEYEQLCPICGSRSVGNIDVEYHCSSCEGKWMKLNMYKRDFLWIKSFGGK